MPKLPDNYTSTPLHRPAGLVSANTSAESRSTINESSAQTKSKLTALQGKVSQAFDARKATVSELAAALDYLDDEDALIADVLAEKARLRANREALKNAGSDAVVDVTAIDLGDAYKDFNVDFKATKYIPSVEQVRMLGAC